MSVFSIEEEKVITRELCSEVDICVENISDLFNYGYDYERAIPFLIEWLPRARDPLNKEMIGRALSVAWARPAAARTVIAEYRKAPRPSQLKWALGNALAVVADASVADEIIELVMDPEDVYRPGDYPSSGRGRVVEALARVPRERAIETLRALLKDEDPRVRRSAAGVIGRRRLVELRDGVASLVDDEAEAVRKTARRVLAGLDRRIAEQAGRKPG